MLNLIDQPEGGFNVTEIEVFRCEERLFFTPARVGLKDLGMSELRPMIGEDTSDGCRTHGRSKTLQDSAFNEIEFGGAKNFLPHCLPNFNDEFVSGSHTNPF